MIRHLAAAALLAATSCTAPAPDAPPRQIAPPVERDRAPVVDVLHYDIDVDLHHEAGFVDGSLGVRFTGIPGAPSSRLVLDAVEMGIDEVYDEFGDDLPYTYDGRVLAIDLGAPLAAGDEREVSIEYSCFPRRGLFFVAPSGRDPRPWHIWSQGQAEDTRHWIPVWDAPDDMATHTLSVSVDPGFTTMAAGERTSSQVGSRSGRRTDSWRMDVPHVSYLITLVAGGYATGTLDAPATGVELPFLVEPRHVDAAEHSLAQTDALIAVIADDVGEPYPHGKYAQCCVKEYTAGGMENISATTLYYEGLHLPQDDPQYSERDLIAHEIAHQWFGDLVTCASWTHLWLNEGFATYYENLALGAIDGQDTYRLTLDGYQRAMVAAELDESRPIVWDGWDLPDDTFATHAYDGGATRLHLLRTILGDAAFGAGVNRFLRDHRGRTVTTADLQASFEAATGVDLERFFDEWLYGAGFPELEGRVVGDVLELRQVQGERGWREVFHAPLTIAWSRGGVEQVTVVDLDEQAQRIPLDGEGPVDWVALDADASLPCRAIMTQPEEAWRRQLAEASSTTARLTAARWFLGDREVRSPDDVTNDASAWRPSQPSHAALAARAVDVDEFWAVRTTALAAMADDARASRLEQLVSDPDPRVRQAVMELLATSTSDYVVPLLADGLGDDNASVVAAALGSLARRGHPSTPSWSDAILAEGDELRWRLDRSVLDALELFDRADGETGDAEVTRRLIGVARRHAVPRVRARALGYLARRRGAVHADVVWRDLAAALHDESFVVRAAAAGALSTWGDPRAVAHLRARADIEPDPSVLGAISAALTSFE